MFANIAEMAKYATLSEDGVPDDGRFEVITQRQTGKLAGAGDGRSGGDPGLGPPPSATPLRLTSRPCPCSWTASS